MTNPFDDDVPTFGFRELHFSPKRRCEVCRRKVYVGLVNINNMDPESPGFKVVCRTCSLRWEQEAKEMPDAEPV